jgi:hypothetical protein
MNVRTSCGLLIIAAAFALAACSSEPTSPASHPTSAPAASAPSAVPAATPAAGSAGAPRVPAGYRIEQHNGKHLYCRSIVPIGSRFPEKKCFTSEQVEELERNTESTINDMERRMPVCGSAGSCSSGG